MKYEYKILVLDSDSQTDERILNGLGAEGWRVVQAVPGMMVDGDGQHAGIE